MRRLLTLLACLWALPAAATDIQEVITPGGLKAWLVESHSLPMISVQVAFRGGTAYDPVGKSGLGTFTAALLTEGAGDLDAAAFARATEDLGIEVAGSATPTAITLGMRTLTDNRARAFELLGLALQKPRFDEVAAQRIRAGQINLLKRRMEQPESIAQRRVQRLVYGNHPYGNNPEGELAQVAEFTARDARRHAAKHLVRANMMVSVVGDITAAELAPLLDKALLNLPQGEAVKPLPLPTSQPAALERVAYRSPQVAVMAGHLGINRHDRDYFPALFLNHVLGGGGFTSRLVEEIREKRGLSYSVYSYFDPLPGRGAFWLGAQTKQGQEGTVLSLMKQQMNRLRNEPISAQEHADARDYLVGSFPLRIDSNEKILSYLTFMQNEGFGRDYLDLWVQRMNAVTPDDVQRAAKRFFVPRGLKAVFVGGDE